MNIIIQKGNIKWNIKILPENIDTYSVKTLLIELSDLTSIPWNRQKLIFKGKYLDQYDKALKDYKITNGSKIMLIGQRESLEENIIVTSIKSVEKEVDKIEKDLEAISQTSHALKQGWLENELSEPDIKKLIACSEKNIEKCMKLIEKIDTLKVGEDFIIAKTMKKMTVDRIMENMHKTDKLIDSIHITKNDIDNHKEKK